ncbi:MAG: terpene cyclase/mutase family protein [Verrucomicrobiae bacterium]|nr:terpene cyclase/mutase family protein [Verrucomicrobiae bacterium]
MPKLICLFVAVSATAAETEVDRAVDRGFEFLRKCQREDGAFDQNIAVHGLAVMAFLARGHVPGSGPDGERVERGLAFTISEQREDGAILGRGGRMYGHGISALLLAEAAGMSKNDRVQVALRKACELILRAQAHPKSKQHQGGWRYEPHSADADISVTGWQLLALRAAKDCGVNVPADAIEQAVGFVKRCASRDGGFGYQPGGGPGLARTGCGMVSLQMCGHYDAEEVRRGAEWVRKRGLRWEDDHFYYAIYYVTQAMYQRGGDDWLWWKSQLEHILLQHQKADGSWEFAPHAGNERQGGPVYTTSMAILSLCVQYHYLPAYQR